MITKTPNNFQNTDGVVYLTKAHLQGPSNKRVIYM